MGTLGTKLSSDSSYQPRKRNRRYEAKRPIAAPIIWPKAITPITSFAVSVIMVVLSSTRCAFVEVLNRNASRRD